MVNGGQRWGCRRGATLSRLEAVKSAQYFPTPPHVAEAIIRSVPVRGLNCRLLDPCAGEGTAAAILAKAWGMKSYGIELNEEREIGRAHV